MRKNIFDLFLNKVFNVPLWIKQVMYLKLAEEMHEKECADFLNNNKDDIFSIFVPTLTFKGKTELTEKKCGLDNNLYNFLQCCADGYNILEISINNFLSMEEVAKYYELCLEQNFINLPESKDIQAMAGYISGKYRLGEYFVQKNIINEEQLQQAILSKNNNENQKFGEILVKLKYVTEQDLKTLLILKEEAQKRFVLDYNTMPKTEIEYSNNDQKYTEEISTLKTENTKLKAKMLQLLELVKKNAVH